MKRPWLAERQVRAGPRTRARHGRGQRCRARPWPNVPGCRGGAACPDRWPTAMVLSRSRMTKITPMTRKPVASTAAAAPRGDRRQLQRQVLDVPRVGAPRPPHPAAGAYPRQLLTARYQASVTATGPLRRHLRGRDAAGDRQTRRRRQAGGNVVSPSGPSCRRPNSGSVIPYGPPAGRRRDLTPYLRPARALTHGRAVGDPVPGPGHAQRRRQTLPGPGASAAPGCA